MARRRHVGRHGARLDRRRARGVRHARRDRPVGAAQALAVRALDRGTARVARLPGRATRAAPGAARDAPRGAGEVRRALRRVLAHLVPRRRRLPGVPPRPRHALHRRHARRHPHARRPPAVVAAAAGSARQVDRAERRRRVRPLPRGRRPLRARRPRATRLGALRAEGPGREQPRGPHLRTVALDVAAPADPSSAAPTRRRGTSRGGSTRDGASIPSRTRCGTPSADRIPPSRRPKRAPVATSPTCPCSARCPTRPTPTTGTRCARSSVRASPRSSSANRSTIPDGWTKTFELGCVQMVLDGEIPPGPVPEHVALGPADVPEMTELVTRTEPGPWRPRTVDFGGYVGVRDTRRARRDGRRAHATARLHRDQRGVHRSRLPRPRSRRRTHARRRGGHRSAWGPSDAARVDAATRARCGCTSRSASAARARWSRWRCRRPTDSLATAPS